jgi:3D (Asp-Asp-Asp) domain-containing protein
MTVEAILLGTLLVTSYRPVPEQTKSTCTGRHACETSIGENVSELGVAVPQDWISSGKVHYRDVLYIDGVGYRIVFDCLNVRVHDSVDVFVYIRAEEKAFGVKHKKVYLIRQKQKSPGGV